MKKNNGRELKSSLIFVGISYSLSLVLWTLWYFGFDRSITVQDGFFERLWRDSDVFYFIIWFIPAFVLLLYASVNKSAVISKQISFERLFSKKISVKKTLLGVSVIFLVILAIKFIRTGSDFSMVGVTYEIFRSALYAAVIEEFIFRASYQNVLRARVKVPTAFLIIAVLFVVGHFPNWAFGGMLSYVIRNGLFLIHFILSLFFSFSFEKSGNVAVPMIFHFFWNFFSGVFKV